MPKKKAADAATQKIGVIYARYSSHAQKDASIEQQVNEGYAYAKQMDIHIVQVYDDHAISGKTDRRPQFQKMMRDAEKGEFGYVIAWKSNRMGRNMLQAMLNEERLSSLGVRVLYIEEDFDDTAAGRFALRSMMNVNQFYSENMAEDIRRGMRDNAMQCKIANGSLPFGYKKSEDGHYAIDEVKAAAVQEIFRRVANGDTLEDIYTSLNARGIKTQRGRPFGKNSFNILLHNERYRGIYIYDDIRVEGGIPRIVSDELFFKVQEVLKMKKNPRGRHRVNGDYLLTGKLFCGECQSPMVGLSGTGRSGALHHYYVCQKKRIDHACKKKNLRREEIERAVAQAICDYALQPDVIEWIADSTLEYNKRREEDGRLLALEDELRDTKRSIKNIMTAIEQGIITDTTKSRLTELERNQIALTGKIAAARADIITVSREDLVAGLSLFRDGDVLNKQFQARLFDTFLVAVYVYDDTLKIVFSFTGNKNTVTVPISTAQSASSSDCVDASAVRIMPLLSHQQKTFL